MENYESTHFFVCDSERLFREKDILGVCFEGKLD